LAGGVVVGEFAKKSKLKREAAVEARVRAFVEHSLALVAKAHGVCAPPLFFTHEVANAKGGNGRIWVNPRWAAGEFNRHCSETVCERTLALALVAHELAHVFDTVNIKFWDRELWADRIAGRTLALAGFSPDPVRRQLENEPSSETHPPGAMRVASILAGYAEIAIAPVGNATERVEQT